MQNIDERPSTAEVVPAYLPVAVGASDGIVTPSTAPARLAIGSISLRAQMWRAWTIAKLFSAFVVKAKLRRWMAKDLDAAIKQEAVWLREVTETLGGTFVKLAQQASIRRDVLPVAYCDELAGLQDRVPALPIETVYRVIEAQTGRPWTDAFSVIDVDPIGSASIGCVYRGVRRDGRQVAIKIRRPGIEQAMALDLAVMDRAVGLLELFGLSAMGLSKGMVSELRHVLAEELNFSLEIRYQGLFRRNLKRWKKVGITAPRVHRDLSGPSLIVSDLVEGIRLKDLLSNLQSQGKAYADTLAQMGIDHRDVGRRLVRGQHFQVHECPFFHADPHPGNIIVQPGGQIVFLDFGACGVLAERDRNLVLEMNRRFATGDVVGMVQCVNGIMEPLPRIDTDAFTAQLEKEWWQGYYGIIDKHAQWHERTSFRLWTALLTTLRSSNIELPSRMLKLVRATLLYDTVAAQLDDKINVFTEFDVYVRSAVKRQRRALQRSLIRQAIEGPEDWVWQRYQQVEKIAGRVLFVAEKFLNEPNLRLDASFNIAVGVVKEMGAVLRGVATMGVAFALLVYSYTRYLRVYEPENFAAGSDLATLPFHVLKSMINGSTSGVVMAGAVALGLAMGALNMLAVYQRLRRLFGQHETQPA